MKSVILFQHLHLFSESNEDVKIIEIYDSRDQALKTIELLKKQAGFSNNSKLIDPIKDNEEEGFYIDEYVINKDHWIEGYNSI